MGAIGEKFVKHATPAEAFRFFSGSENMNLPAIYAFAEFATGRQFLSVVGRNFDRTFPVSEFDSAVAFYRMVLEEHGYLEGPKEERSL